MIMILKPQDVVILLKLIVRGPSPWSYGSLAQELVMSPSEVHGGLKRATAAKLYDPQRKVALIAPLEEFLFHGIKYAFPPDRGALTRGMPTSHAAPPLKALLSVSDEPPPVWPDPEGSTRGTLFSPLFQTVPKAAKCDAALYELLALVDALREGRARERELAEKLLREKLEASR